MRVAPNETASHGRRANGHQRRWRRAAGRLAIAVVAALGVHCLLFLLPVGEVAKRRDRPVLSVEMLPRSAPDRDAAVGPSTPEKIPAAPAGKPRDPSTGEEASEPSAPRDIAAPGSVREDEMRESPPSPSESHRREPPREETVGRSAAPEEEQATPAEEPSSLAAAAEPAPERAPAAEPLEPPPEPSAEPGDLDSVDLFPSEALSSVATPSTDRRPSDPGETLRSEPAGPSHEERADRAERRVAAYVRNEKARHRVETGLVDPYFVRLREAFAEDFEPKWDHLEDDGEGMAADLGAWLRDQAGAMQRYAETGSPYHEGEKSSIDPNDRLAGPGPPSSIMAPDDSRRDMRVQGMRDALFMDIATGRAGGRDLVAVLRVIQAPNGALLRVEIERSSGRRDYDDLARATIRSALATASLPEREGEGLGLEGDRIESLWAFRTRFVVVPPLAGGCLFDTDGTVDCMRPLQRRVLPDVELRAVY